MFITTNSAHKPIKELKIGEFVSLHSTSTPANWQGSVQGFTNISGRVADRKTVIILNGPEGTRLLAQYLFYKI